MKPAAMFGRIVSLQSLRQSTRCSRFNRLIQGGNGVRVEIGADSKDFFSLGGVIIEQMRALMSPVHSCPLWCGVDHTPARERLGE